MILRFLLKEEFDFDLGLLLEIVDVVVLVQLGLFQPPLCGGLGDGKVALLPGLFIPKRNHIITLWNFTKKYIAHQSGQPSRS